MKYLIAAVGFAAALGMSQMMLPMPAKAQSADDIRRTCIAKHGTGKNSQSLSEDIRKASQAKIAACIRSGGKS